MLRPQENATREAKRLDGLWDFSVDTNGVGREERWWQGPLVNAIPMPVPSSYNDVLVDPAVHDHVGDVWYQRTVFVPRGWQGGRVVLRFDAATHRADVWVGDEQVVSHEGGYTPFEADLTEHRGTWRRGPHHRRRQQRAHLGIDPTRSSRGNAGRSTSPAAIPRLLQLLRPPSKCLAVFDSAVLHRGRHSDSRQRARSRRRRILDRHRRAGEPTVRVELYDARGNAGGLHNRRRRRTSGNRTPSLAARKRLPLRTPC